MSPSYCGRFVPLTFRPQDVSPLVWTFGRLKFADDGEDDVVSAVVFVALFQSDDNVFCPLSNLQA